MIRYCSIEKIWQCDVLLSGYRPWVGLYSSVNFTGEEAVYSINNNEFCKFLFLFSIPAPIFLEFQLPLFTVIYNSVNLNVLINDWYAYMC